MRTVKAGQLRHTVELQAKTPSGVNAYGEPTESWGTYATVHASIDPVTGREFTSGGGIRSDVTHKIVIRHNSSCGAGDRVKFGSRYFYIVSYVSVGGRDWVGEIMAREEVA